MIKMEIGGNAMEILFFEESYFLRQGLLPNIGSIIVLFIGLIAFIKFGIYYRKEKFFVVMSIIASATLIMLMGFLRYYSNNHHYITCKYELILEEEVPEGYDIISQRGKITSIQKTMNKEDYEKHSCELED